MEKKKIESPPTFRYNFIINIFSPCCCHCIVHVVTNWDIKERENCEDPPITLYFVCKVRMHTVCHLQQARKSTRAKRKGREISLLLVIFNFFSCSPTSHVFIAENRDMVKRVLLLKWRLSLSQLCVTCFLDRNRFTKRINHNVCFDPSVPCKNDEAFSSSITRI